LNISKERDSSTQLQRFQSEILKLKLSLATHTIATLDAVELLTLLILLQ